MQGNFVTMNDVTRSVLGWLGAYTYPIVFLGTLIDASGVPFPGRLLLVAAGALAGRGRESVVGIVVLAAVAAVIMDHLWFLAGVRGGEGLWRLWHRLSGRRADSETARKYVARYGALTILLGRFFTSLRAIVWPVAAARGIRYPTFLMMDIIAASLWASLWVLLGWFVGDQWESVAETVGLWLAVAGGAVFALIAVAVTMRIHRRRSLQHDRSAAH